MEWTSSGTVSGAAVAATTSSVVTLGGDLAQDEPVGRGVEDGEVGDDSVDTASRSAAACTPRPLAEPWTMARANTPRLPGRLTRGTGRQKWPRRASGWWWRRAQRPAGRQVGGARWRESRRP